ncbi:multidrug resistance-associated protein 5 [Tanacetum coccineum]
MASDSQEVYFLIKYHRGGVFVRNPFSYDYEILSEIPNVDLVSLGLVGFISLLETEFTSSMKSLFYLVPGLDFHLGLKPLKCEADFKECVECGVNNDHVLHVYASHSEFDLNETTTEQNDNSGSDLEDDDYNVYDYCSSEESDTTSVDHLSDDEEEVLDVRTKKRDPTPKKKASKMFDESFFTSIFNGLPRDDFDDSSDPKIDDQDKLGDHWPIHDPKIKWKLIRPHLGERYEGPEQLKRALTYYALANGYKLYFEVNNPRRLVAKCSKDNQEKKCPFRLWASWMQSEKSFQIKNMIDEHVCSKTYEYGSLIKSNWIARNYAKKIMINPSIKVRDIIALTCLEDHYGMLWSYAAEILNSNEGSTCKLGVDVLPDSKAYFSSFYVFFKALKEGWLEGYRRVIGLDVYFLNTLCNGELLLVCLINDLGIVDGEGLTIISDQHKGIIEAAKDVMPLAEHRQCARHIYAKFRKKFTGVQFRSLFWQAAKATYPAKFEKIMQEIKDLRHRSTQASYGEKP